MTMFELLHQTTLADTDLLRKNDEVGDNFTKAREVDFAFKTGDKQRADDFAEFVNGKSYGTAAVNKITDGHFRVLVLITMPITQHLIGCVSGFMLCLSRLFQINYLGWGSVVQKPCGVMELPVLAQKLLQKSPLHSLTVDCRAAA